MSGAASIIRFSVIVPAYNAAATIVPALQSVIGQRFPPFEIIVVNDGSTDTTEEVLLDHFGDRIVYIALDRNYGPAYARNRGIVRATGTHIAFQDADDRWHTDKLQLLAAVISREPDPHFIFHPYTLADLPADTGRYSLDLARYPFLKLLLSNPVGTPCVVMRRDGTIRFNEAMHYMEDYDLFLREAYKHGLYFLNIPLTRLGRPILSAGGQSGKRWSMRRGEFRAYLNLIRINPLFLLVSLPLIAFGLMKHLVKSFFPPRSNY